MKVLYIAPEYPNEGKNAAQVRANSLLPRLAHAVDLRVFAFPPDGFAGKNELSDNITVAFRAAPTRMQLFKASFSSRPRSFIRYNLPETRVALAQLLEDFKPDCVHFDSIGTLALMDVVRAASCDPQIIAHMHDSVASLYRTVVFGGSTRAFVSQFGEYLKILSFEKSLSKNANAIIVDSPEDAETFQRMNGTADVYNIPLGVDTKTFSSLGASADIEQPSVVFSGSMRAEQSVDAAEFLAKEVMPLVWQNAPDAHLYLVGANPTNAVRNLRSDRVHVTGFVDDIASYLRASSVYCCPLRLGSGMRTRAIEALACGCRVLATNFAMRGITPPQDGFSAWREAETPIQFSHAILETIRANSNSKDQEVLTNYIAENYSWDAVTRQIVELYHQSSQKKALSA